MVLVSTGNVERQYLIFLRGVAKRGESEGDFRPSQLWDSPPQRVSHISKYEQVLGQFLEYEQVLGFILKYQQVYRTGPVKI